MTDQRKFLWQSPHWAEFPDATGLPVTSDLLHCLHSFTLQFLQVIESLLAHPDEYLHMFPLLRYYNIL